MRLTLRTLLAWMDDTLPPAEVKEIGEQVAASPFAQQLMEKIRKVTRQRRLAIPPTSGEGSIDANLVAAYLDNELDADRVAEVEKLCLTSDVNLAEAASCHQILSMIKHKAKVPAEARYRMYRLVRGREAARPTERGRGRPAASANGGPSVPPWSPSTPPKASGWERFGPLLVTAALMGVLAWVGLTSLRPTEQLTPAALASSEPPDDSIDPVPERPLAGDPGPMDDQGPAEAETPLAELVEPEAERVAVADDAAPPRALAAPAASVVATDGLLFRFEPDDSSWSSLMAADEIRAGDRLIHLEPLAATLTLGEVRLTLVGASEIVVGAPGDGQAARFDLVRGRAVLAPPADGSTTAPVAIGFQGEVVVIERPATGSVGLMASGYRPTGVPVGRMILSVMVDEGKAVVSTEPATKVEALEGPAALAFESSTGLSPVQSSPVPPWIANPGPSPVERQHGADFVKLFGDGSLMFSLLEGLEDARPAIQSLSVAALGAVGGDEQIVALLGRSGSPALRRSALGVIQSWLAERPDGLETLRPLLLQYAESPEVAEELEHLSVGFGPEELTKESTFVGLVKGLLSVNPSVREMAISALMGLTGRDSLGYDPDNPDAGAREWQALLRDGKIGPQRTRTPKPAAKPAT